MPVSMASVAAKRYWRIADAEVVLAELASSGHGLGSFCRRWGIDEQRVRSWQKRARASCPASEAMRFVEVVGGVANDGLGPSVVNERRRSDSGPPAVEVVLPTGVRLRVLEGRGVAWTAALIRALSC